MPTINLQTAAAKIHQIVDQRHKRGLSSPFFFVVGAGVSHPPIPLAFEIEEHCKRVAESYGDTSSPVSELAIDTYSHWFSKAYPSSAELQSYLRGLMEAQPISKANLRLAHLILDGTVARTVFTTNFDDMLTKALELFGQRPLVCDHPLTVSRMRIESKDIQIIHVHGSYWFYDCCNLRLEIHERARSAPMSAILDQTLRDSSPLVIGYSGWEGDIIMASLKRRLEAGRLGSPIYWFCHRRESVDALPDWLTRHNDVQFVVPEENAVTPLPNSATQVSGTSIPAFLRLSAAASSGLFVEEAIDRRLTADKVFDALVRQFDLPAPPFTENPLRFYAAQLKELLGAGDPNDVEPDTYYSFHTVIARVERASDSEASKIPERLQEFRDAMSKADYIGAVANAQQIDLNGLSASERKEVVFVAMDASFGLYDDPVAEIAAYDLVVKFGDSFAREDAVDAKVQEHIARALLYKGITLGAQKKPEEEINLYDELVQRYSDAQEPEVKKLVASALFNKGLTLDGLKGSEEAIQAYDELVQRFGNAQEPQLSGQVARALFNKGFALRALGRSEEEIEAYDDLLERYGDSEDPTVSDAVARALLYKGLALGALKGSEEEIEVYDNLLQRYGDSGEPQLRKHVARALLFKEITLAFLERNEDAIAVCEKLLQRYSDAEELELRDAVARALLHKGIALDALKRGEEAIEVYDLLLHRYGGAQERELREVVARALLYKGVTFHALGKSEEEIGAYDQLLQRNGDDRDPELMLQFARALLYKAFTLGVLRRNGEAIEVYDQLLQRYGDAQASELKDPVARALLNKGRTAEESGKNETAIAAYEDLICRAASLPKPLVAELVAVARLRLEVLKGC